jgi:hypothetical protein
MTRGKRKLTDARSFDELVRLQEALKKHHIESSFEIRRDTRHDADRQAGRHLGNSYRVLVGLGDLCCARTIIAAIAFQEGQKLLGGSQR